MKIRMMTLATAIAVTLAAPTAIAGSMSKEGSSHADRQEAGMAHGKDAGVRTQRMSFDELDANNDGAITEDELNVYGNSAAGTGDSAAERDRMALKAHDRNKDGKITRGEFMKGADAKKPANMNE